MKLEDDRLVNDVHSRLNATRVARLERPTSLDEISRAIRRAAAEATPISICGARHAMGGQQFGAGTLLLDVSEHRRIHSLDSERGWVKADAGIRWPELIEGLHALQRGIDSLWSIRQKQTGADELSLGGALSANVHGRGLSRPPIIADVEAFTLVDANGAPRVCSRAENADLFRLAIGGYGVFGVIADVTLRLERRRKLERRVEILGLEELIPAVDGRRAAGYEYGDFQFSTDERSPDFLKRGVFSCYRPIADDRPIPATQASLGAEDWGQLLYLAHTDRAQVFERYTKYYLMTDGQLYWSDVHQLGTYLDGYHTELDTLLGASHAGSEMITELYVPRASLTAFMNGAAEMLREREAQVIYGTVRLIERDDESFLAWAQEPFACIIFNLHIDHLPSEIEKAAVTFRALIDLAIGQGGSFYLTYHRWATRRQLETCYPQLPEFLELQRKHDPSERWQSDWLRHLRV